VKLRDIPFSLRHSLANRGLIRSVAIAPRKIVSRLLRGSAQEKQAVLLHPFDAEFGTDTGGMIYAEELRDGRGRKSVYNTAYYATPPSLFLQALARLEIDFAEFTFIHLGAGKGRVILLASNFPFRQVIGIEFARDLATVVTRNISDYRPSARVCEDMRCMLGDASDFVFPPGPLVIFMWNPFVGLVFERVLSNLEDSLRREPREVYLLYLKPDCGQRLDASSALHKIWECRLEMTERDFAFYHLGGRSVTCAAYRSSIPAEDGAGNDSRERPIGGLA
jgi:hypothetical protein